MAPPEAEQLKEQWVIDIEGSDAQTAAVCHCTALFVVMCVFVLKCTFTATSQDSLGKVVQTLVDSIPGLSFFLSLIEAAVDAAINLALSIPQSIFHFDPPLSVDTIEQFIADQVRSYYCTMHR